MPLRFRVIPSRELFASKDCSCRRVDLSSTIQPPKDGAAFGVSYEVNVKRQRMVLIISVVLGIITAAMVGLPGIWIVGFDPSFGTAMAAGIAGFFASLGVFSEML